MTPPPPICIIDTSIMCEILAVPHLCSDARHEILLTLSRKDAAREQLLVPLAAIIETGNHIGQNGDGRQRRAAAQRFVSQVSKALRGEAPFAVAQLPADVEDFVRLLETFPDQFAAQGIGLGDLTIHAAWEAQIRRFRGRRVYIWSLDKHLSAYDTG